MKQKLFFILLIFFILFLTTLNVKSLGANKSVPQKFPAPKAVLSLTPTAKAAKVLGVIAPLKSSPTKKPSLPYYSPTPVKSEPTPKPQIDSPTAVPTSPPMPLSSASSTPEPSSTPTTKPEAQQTSLEINFPDKTIATNVEIHDGMNICDVLTKAKDNGTITSLTLDDSYLSAFHSSYVLEINGFKNNWTFTVNGTSPLGCSLYTVKPGDVIKWKFG